MKQIYILFIYFCTINLFLNLEENENEDLPQHPHLKNTNLRESRSCLFSYLVLFLRRKWIISKVILLD